jgi:hypothetical protein
MIEQHQERPFLLTQQDRPAHALPPSLPASVAPCLQLRIHGVKGAHALKVNGCYGSSGAETRGGQLLWRALGASAAVIECMPSRRSWQVKPESRCCIRFTSHLLRLWLHLLPFVTHLAQPWQRRLLGSHHLRRRTAECAVPDTRHPPPCFLSLVTFLVFCSSPTLNHAAQARRAAAAGEFGTVSRKRFTSRCQCARSSWPELCARASRVC